jgi:hypothetical protein
MSNSENSAEINQVEVLDQLGDMFQAAHEAVLAAESNGLDSAIKAGTVLHAIKDRVGNMKAWMAEHKPNVPVSTWKMYLQVSDPDNRLVIETARKTNPHLNINAARKLLVKKPRPKKKPETAVPSITDEQLIAALTARGPDWFVMHMPEGWRAWLQARLRGPVLRAAAAAHPNARMKNVVKLVHSAPEPTTHH